MAYEITDRIEDPAYEYGTEMYCVLGDIFEDMIDTVYDEISLRKILDDILTDKYAINPIDSEENEGFNLLLSIYYKNENVLDYCFRIKDGLFDYFMLYNEKDDFEKVIDIVYNGIKKYKYL